MKKYLLICLLLFIFAGAVFASMPSDSEIGTAASKLGVPFGDLKAFVSKYYVSSDINDPDVILKGFDDIYKFYNENEDNSLKFFKKYEKKCIEFQDIVVYSVDKSAFNFKEYRVSCALVYGKSYYLVFYLPITEEDKIFNLSKGSTITIRGFIKEQSSTIHLYDSVIIHY